MKKILLGFLFITNVVFPQSTPTLKQVLGAGNDANGKKITNVANAVSSQDVVTLSQLGSYALKASPLSQFASTTAAELFSIIANVTGTAGGLVFSVAPTLSNPIVGTQAAKDSSLKAASTQYVDKAISVNVPSVSTGIWRINSAVGTPTYYSTFSAARTAANAGQDIELNADITQTLLEDSLKHHVNINLNGHALTFNGSNSLNGFTDAGVSCELSITNGKIIYNGNSVYALKISNASSNINCSGLQIFCPNGYGVLIQGHFSGAYVNGQYPITLFTNNTATASDCTVDCTVAGGQAVIIYNGSINRFSITSSSSVKALDIRSGGCKASNTYVYNSSGNAVEVAGGGFAYNVTGVSDGARGFYSYSGSVCNLCNAVSNATYNIIFGQWNGGTISSSASYACEIQSNNLGDRVSGTEISANTERTVFGIGDLKINNCIIVSDYNSVNGHAVQVDASGTSEITNCSLRTLHASANCIYASSSANVKFAGNTYGGSTTPVNANITQYINALNVADAQGNVLINH